MEHHASDGQEPERGRETAQYTLGELCAGILASDRHCFPSPTGSTEVPPVSKTNAGQGFISHIVNVA
jgi:hypothetical protein